MNQHGIFAGCTISIIWFSAGTNVILEYSLQVQVAKFVIKNNSLPLVRAFIDDLNLLSSSVSGAKTLVCESSKVGCFGFLGRQVQKYSHN